jgi:hypothetical protein
LIVPALILVLSLGGCAQKRQNIFGGSTTTKPKSPGLFSSRPEPGLRVRAPFTDVEVIGREDSEESASASDSVEDGDDARLSSRSPRVGLFRNSSSDRSLPEELPIN